MFCFVFKDVITFSISTIYKVRSPSFRATPDILVATCSLDCGLDRLERKDLHLEQMILKNSSGIILSVTGIKGPALPHSKKNITPIDVKGL